MLAVALALYAVPTLVLLAARARRDVDRGELALLLPLSVATDLLVVLLLARVVRLETAWLASRVLWLATGAAVVILRRRRGDPPRWPEVLGRRELVAVAGGALVGVVLSRTLLDPAIGADGSWHVPLSSSLLGQRIPFANVYQPGRVLGYHSTGDVLAAGFRALSFATLGTARGLATLHTVMLATTGATLALLGRALGLRSGLLAVAGATAVLLAGPLAWLRGPALEASGYNFVAFLRISFRPHVPVAALALVGFVGAALVRLARPARPLATTLPPLVGSTALLALTDEASVGLLGLGLGVAWLLAPQVLAPTRKQGLVIFGGLVAALVIPNLLFPGSLAPGAPKHALAIVPWRAPGYLQKTLPLSDPQALRLLLHDLAPSLAVTALALLLALRLQRRPVTALAAFAATVHAAATFALTRLDVDGLPVENHRFFTVAMLALPLVALALLCHAAAGPGADAVAGAEVGRARRWLGRLRASPEQGAPALGFALVVALAAPVPSTLQWLSSAAGGFGTTSAKLDSPLDLLRLDCRRDLGARLGQVARPAYVERTLFYAWAACHPLYAHAPSRGHWEMKTHLPEWGAPALQELHRQMLGPEQPLTVGCWATPVGARDPICEYARQHGSCTQLGKAIRCDLSAAQREQLLGSLSGRR